MLKGLKTVRHFKLSLLQSYNVVISRSKLRTTDSRTPVEDWTSAEDDHLKARYGNSWQTIIRTFWFHEQRTAADLKEDYARLLNYFIHYCISNRKYANTYYN